VSLLGVANLQMNVQIPKTAFLFYFINSSITKMLASVNHPQSTSIPLQTHTIAYWVQTVWIVESNCMALGLITDGENPKEEL
jgi:hypothetical protein